MLAFVVSPEAIWLLEILPLDREPVEEFEINEGLHDDIYLALILEIGVQRSEARKCREGLHLSLEIRKCHPVKVQILYLGEASCQVWRIT